jgi:O-antigen/teichoic acid export membrane protein
LESRAQLASTFSRYLKVVIPFAIVLATALPFLIPLVYGRAYGAVVPTSEILLLAGVVLGAAVVLGAGGQALGDPWIASRAQICAVPVTVGLLLLLLPRFGILGAGLASLAAYTAQLIIIVFGLRKHGIKWRPVRVGEPLEEAI